MSSIAGGRRARLAFSGGLVLNGLAAAGMLATAVIALLAPQVLHPGIGDGGQAFADYFAARNAILVLAICLAAARRAVRPLAWLLAMSGAVQLLDVVVGLVTHDVGGIAGPAIAALIQIGTAVACGTRGYRKGQD